MERRVVLEVVFFFLLRVVVFFFGGFFSLGGGGAFLEVEVGVEVDQRAFTGSGCPNLRKASIMNELTETQAFIANADCL